MSAVWYACGLDILEDVHGRAVPVARVKPGWHAERNAGIIASGPALMVALIDVMSECLDGEVARGNGAGKMSEAMASAIELLAYIDGRESEIYAPAPPAEGGTA